MAQRLVTFTVIHDLNYLYFPKVVSLLKRWWLRISHHITLKQATAVVAISDFVSNDITTKYQVSPSVNIATIPNPISWHRFTIATPPSHFVPSKFILTVAYQYRHKNLATLVKAFSQLSVTCPNIQLVLVGQLTQNIHGIRYDTIDDIPNLVAQLNLTHKVIITGYINDRELSWYYHHATVFAFPSIFEGFGMPPVEAMGMGLPVLTTRCTAIPEVTLGLANYVDDPLSVSEWTEKLQMIVESPDQFTPTQDTVNLIRATYTPQTIAQEYINLIKSKSKNMFKKYVKYNNCHRD
jgi:glycosyltransferase involved in cell wall biosynthesis